VPHWFRRRVKRSPAEVEQCNRVGVDCNSDWLDFLPTRLATQMSRSCLTHSWRRDCTSRDCRAAQRDVQGRNSRVLDPQSTPGQACITIAVSADHAHSTRDSPLEASLRSWTRAHVCTHGDARGPSTHASRRNGEHRKLCAA
jgi:hypothetical protein